MVYKKPFLVLACVGFLLALKMADVSTQHSIRRMPLAYNSNSTVQSKVHADESSSLLDSCGRRGRDLFPSSNQTRSLTCTDEHQTAIDYCQSINQVKQREGDRFARPAKRQYSLVPLPPGPGLPECDNLRDYLSSIKLGTRYWLDEKDKGDESIPSTFKAHKCYGPQVPPPKRQVCKILNQYSSVIFHGDSLTRHLRQAIYMAMRGNYTHGGVVSDSSQTHEDCFCDGQFSEAKSCRENEIYFKLQSHIQRIPGNLCPGDSSFSLGKVESSPFLERKNKTNPGKHIAWKEIRCKRSSYKGVLLVMQGGSHWKMNATATYEEFVRPTLDHKSFGECIDRGKIRVIWLAATAQSAALDVRYPQQSRSAAIEFNRKMQEYLNSSGFGDEIVTVDWWNLTADSPTSDGLHSLTDVNLAKAAQVLYLSERWPFPKARVEQAAGEDLSQAREYVSRSGHVVMIPAGVPMPPD